MQDAQAMNQLANKPKCHRRAWTNKIAWYEDRDKVTIERMEKPTWNILCKKTEEQVSEVGFKGCIEV